MTIVAVKLTEDLSHPVEELSDEVLSCIYMTLVLNCYDKAFCDIFRDDSMFGVTSFTELRERIWLFALFNSYSQTSISADNRIYLEIPKEWQFDLRLGCTELAARGEQIAEAFPIARKYMENVIKEADIKFGFFDKRRKRGPKLIDLESYLILNTVRNMQKLTAKRSFIYSNSHEETFDWIYSRGVWRKLGPSTPLPPG